MTSPGKWVYVAPHRIRSDSLALPAADSWDEIESLNLQRFARVLEFSGCIGFVGSGASACFNYPRWDELLPDPREEYPPEYRSLCEALKAGQLEATQAIQIAQKLLDPGLKGAAREVIEDSIQARFQGKEEIADRTVSPFEALTELPISRFITTNYDQEIELELAGRLKGEFSTQRKSFSQDDLEKVALFSIALAKGNRQMVFHCHGKLSAPASRVGAEPKRRSNLVLTDDDYNYWYLSREPVPFTFQKSMDVILNSNPLFFVGYSLRDVDLVRILRHLTLRQNSERLASSVFALVDEMPAEGPEREQAPQESLEHARIARQIKYGINLFPFTRRDANRNPKGLSLAEVIRQTKGKADNERKRWREQPKARKASASPSGWVQPRNHHDPLFLAEHLEQDSALKEMLRVLSTSRLLAVIGAVGSGKLTRISQLSHQLHQDMDGYRCLVFHPYNNDDIYSYLKRIANAVAEFTAPANESASPTQGAVARLLAALDHPYRAPSFDPHCRKKRLLVVVSNIDLFLDMGAGADPVKVIPDVDSASDGGSSAPFPKPRISTDWKERNKASSDLVAKVYEWFNGETTGENCLIVTSRVLPATWRGKEEPLRPVPVVDLNCFNFPAQQIGLQSKPSAYQALCWELPGEQSAMLLAASFLTHHFERGARKAESGCQPEAVVVDKKEEKLEGLLRAVQANTSERGTRVVRHVIRAMDKDKGEGRRLEHLLTFLSCFSNPIDLEVFRQCVLCSSKSFTGEEPKETAFEESDIQRLVELRLLEKIADPGREGPATYIVPRLVKRYCRMILEKTQHPEMRACGIHGLLSRGPFNSPGKSSSKAQLLFEHFARAAYHIVRGTGGNPKAKVLITASIDILRSNFACNSVPQWGRFRDYIDMLTMTIDLLKNYALVQGSSTWFPGEEAGLHWLSDHGVASAEEMLYLYNELGLALYNTGSVQDALSVWGLAMTWQRVVFFQDEQQGTMYAASLNAHLAMGYLQQGRLDTAKECVERALAAARETSNDDLILRLQGIEGRLAHFRGDVPRARSTYARVVRGLGKCGNKRAESYFMRLHAALELRFGDKENAERMARESMSIGASQNAPDLVAFASELLGRTYHAQGKTQAAIQEYRIALNQAKELDIAGLQADVLLGLAKIQLDLGDAHAARSRALEAMVLANIHLLVVRQIKSLILLGKAAAELGEATLPVAYFKQAERLASDSQFRLAEHDAQGALAELRVGGRDWSH